MMHGFYARKHDKHEMSRPLAAGVSAGLEIALVLLLWFGLSPPSALREVVHDSIAAITLPPAPVKPPPQQHHHARAGRAAPANLRAKAAPVLAISQPLLKPVPIPVSPMVAIGLDAHSGAAPVPGPGSGSGAGGQGTGTGSGGNGNGEGNGGSDPEWTGGRIKPSDYPLAAREAEAQGTTSVTISVTAQGRPSACHLVHSSHNRDLDDRTCDLVLQRFRFRPARDAGGHAVAGEVDYDQEWTLGILTDAP